MAKLFWSRSWVFLKGV